MEKDSRGTELSNVIRIDDERMRADSDEVGRAFRLKPAGEFRSMPAGVANAQDGEG